MMRLLYRGVVCLLYPPSATTWSTAVVSLETVCRKRTLYISLFCLSQALLCYSFDELPELLRLCRETCQA